MEYALERERLARASVLAQQAAEKALKAAWIHLVREPPPRTNVLPELLPPGASPPVPLEDLYWLTKYYTVAWYPDAAGGPPSRLIVEWEARRAASVAKRPVEWAEEVLRDP